MIEAATQGLRYFFTEFPGRQAATENPPDGIPNQGLFLGMTKIVNMPKNRDEKPGDREWQAPAEPGGYFHLEKPTQVQFGFPSEGEPGRHGKSLEKTTNKNS